MEDLSLQFQGAGNTALLICVWAAVTAALVCYGIVMLARGRKRMGLISLSAALGLLWAALLVDAAIRYSRRDRRSAGRVMLAWAILAAATAAAAALYVATGEASAAIMCALGIQVAAAVGVFYAAVYAYLGTARLAGLMVLRCAAIASLMLILFKPAISCRPSGDELKPPLPILVDRSGSMSVADEPNAPDRYQHALGLLGAQRRRIERTFRPQWHHFATSLDKAGSLKELSALQPRGAGTDIAAALTVAAAKYGRGSIPGVILISDGIHNSPSSAADAAVEAGVPVFVLAVGSRGRGSAGRPNIELLTADAPLEVTKNNTATITVRAKVTGISNPPGVQLFEEGNAQPLAVEPLAGERQGPFMQAKLTWTPRDDAQAGSVRKLRLAIAPHAAEADDLKADNEIRLHVLVGEPQIRVLYVEGTIRPEFKFLRRALDSDPNVQFMALVRISGKRFWAQGSFGGVKLMQLPTSQKDFKLFDVLLMGDLDSTFWGQARLAAIKKFVNDGGGLMMIGGSGSFGAGGYGGTDLEDVLPVVMGPRSQKAEPTAFVPQLTAAGQRHPIFAGISGYFFGPGGAAPKSGLAALPKLNGCVRVVRAKSGTTLAVHPTRQNDAGPLVIMAAQRFGAGRSVAFTADTTWKWYMPLAGLGADSPYHRFWGQTIRWLANVKTKRRKATPAAILRLDRSHIQTGQAAGLLSKVRTADGTPPADVQVSCTVSLHKKVIDTLPLAAGPEAGTYEATYRPPRDGNYTLRIIARGKDGKILGADSLPLLVRPRSSELENTDRNDRLLREIARRSDGAYEDIARLPELLDVILARQKGMAAPRPTVRRHRLYNFPVLFVLFVALVTAEWLLRHKWQLH